MLIKVNGEEIEVKDASSIQDVINITNAPYSPGSVVCLIKGKQSLETNVSKYRIKTNQGSIILELVESEEATPLCDFWKNHYEDFVNLNIRWSTPSEVAIGPVKTDFEPTSDRFKYFEGDVLLSLSSFSNESTHLIFIKENVENVYSVPSYNKGIFAKIIGGHKTLDKLTNDDLIKSIEPIVERNEITDSASISDLSTIMEEGNELYTYLSLDINENSPICVEHLFSLINEGSVEVNFDSNSFLGFYKFEKLNKPKESVLPRNRGSITVRNDGVGIGRVYIYRENRVISEAHTNVGQIVKGLELLDTAKQGDFLTIRSEKSRIMTLDITQKEASELLNSLGIEHVREGVVDDDALIVNQEPFYTMDIIKEGKVITKGINKEDLLHISFNDEAPRSIWYFKNLTGLLENPIGSLDVYFAVPSMNLLMFDGDKKTSKGLIPENSPKDMVKACEIGITNMASKKVGLIGIRFEDNTEYGPTADTFNATNIIGKIDADIENLKKLKEGDVLYVKQSLSKS